MPAPLPYRELVELIEETCARLQDGDDAFLETAIHRRDAVLAAIAKTPVSPQAAPEVRTAIGHALELDRALLTILEARREQVRLELGKLGAQREALLSYRGTGRTSAFYVERLG